MQKQKAVFEECIENYLYKAKTVLKIQLRIPKVSGNEVVWKWFTNARSKNIHTAGQK
jgi:uncharacterized membrane protein